MQSEQGKIPAGISTVDGVSQNAVRSADVATPATTTNPTSGNFNFLRTFKKFLYNDMTHFYEMNVVRHLPTFRVFGVMLLLVILLCTAVARIIALDDAVQTTLAAVFPGKEKCQPFFMFICERNFDVYLDVAPAAAFDGFLLATMLLLFILLCTALARFVVRRRTPTAVTAVCGWGRRARKMTEQRVLSGWSACARKSLLQARHAKITQQEQCTLTGWSRLTVFLRTKKMRQEHQKTFCSSARREMSREQQRPSCGAPASSAKPDPDLQLQDDLQFGIFGKKKSSSFLSNTATTSTSQWLVQRGDDVEHTDERNRSGRRSSFYHLHSSIAAAFVISLRHQCSWREFGERQLVLFRLMPACLALLLACTVPGHGVPVGATAVKILFPALGGVLVVLYWVFRRLRQQTTAVRRWSGCVQKALQQSRIAKILQREQPALAGWSCCVQNALQKSRITKIMLQEQRMLAGWSRLTRFLRMKKLRQDHARAVRRESEIVARWRKLSRVRMRIPVRFVDAGGRLIVPQTTFLFRGAKHATCDCSHDGGASLTYHRSGAHDSGAYDCHCTPGRPITRLRELFGERACSVLLDPDAQADLFRRLDSADSPLRCVDEIPLLLGGRHIGRRYRVVARRRVIWLGETSENGEDPPSVETTMEIRFYASGDWVIALVDEEDQSQPLRGAGLLETLQPADRANSARVLEENWRTEDFIDEEYVFSGVVGSAEGMEVAESEIRFSSGPCTAFPEAWRRDETYTRQWPVNFAHWLRWLSFPSGVGEWRAKIGALRVKATSHCIALFVAVLDYLPSWDVKLAKRQLNRAGTFEERAEWRAEKWRTAWEQYRRRVKLRDECLWVRAAQYITCDEGTKDLIVKVIGTGDDDDEEEDKCIEVFVGIPKSSSSVGPVHILEPPKWGLQDKEIFQKDYTWESWAGRRDDLSRGHLDIMFMMLSIWGWNRFVGTRISAANDLLLYQMEQRDLARWSRLTALLRTKKMREERTRAARRESEIVTIWGNFILRVPLRLPVRFVDAGGRLIVPPTTLAFPAFPRQKFLFPISKPRQLLRHQLYRTLSDPNAKADLFRRLDGADSPLRCVEKIPLFLGGRDMGRRYRVVARHHRVVWIYDAKKKTVLDTTLQIRFYSSGCWVVALVDEGQQHWRAAGLLETMQYVDRTSISKNNISSGAMGFPFPVDAEGVERYAFTGVLADTAEELEEVAESEIRIYGGPARLDATRLSWLAGLFECWDRSINTAT
ncbi:unnamed protein product [Amoebophrya sp. A120]|nr:unnamed protein product [Amoebophrya sp. A120]|eukprot:GSA120T00024304001.1